MYANALVVSIVTNFSGGFMGFLSSRNVIVIDLQTTGSRLYLFPTDLFFPLESVKKRKRKLMRCSEKNIRTLSLLF